MKLCLYCTCGASFVSSGHRTPELAEYRKAQWNQRHAGPGHAPTDARTAAQARRKKQRAARRKENSP